MICAGALGLLGKLGRFALATPIGRTVSNAIASSLGKVFSKLGGTNLLKSANTAMRGFLGKAMKGIASSPVGRYFAPGTTANYSNLLDDAAVRHVIKGDAWGSGGHAWFGSVRSFFHGVTGKKSMFPITWSKRRILHEISDVATSSNMRLMNPNVVRRAGGLPSAAGVAEYGGSMRGVFAYVRGTRIHSGYPSGSRYYQLMRPVHRRWDRLPRGVKYGIGGGVGALGIWGGYELFAD